MPLKFMNLLLLLLFLFNIFLYLFILNSISNVLKLSLLHTLLARIVASS